MYRSIPKFKIRYDFITEDQEKELMSLIKTHPKKESTDRNTVIRYGKSYYNDTLFSTEIPRGLKFFSDLDYDSVCINEYHEGQGIDYHIDAGGDVVTLISLLSDAEMSFRNPKTMEQFTIQVPKRSLVQFSDELRWDWEHCILPVKELRYSIAYRKSKKGD